MDFYGVQFLQLLTYVRTLVTATTITSSVKGPSRKEEHQSIKKRESKRNARNKKYQNGKTHLID